MAFVVWYLCHLMYLLYIHLPLLFFSHLSIYLPLCLSLFLYIYLFISSRTHTNKHTHTHTDHQPYPLGPVSSIINQQGRIQDFKWGGALSFWQPPS